MKTPSSIPRRCSLELLPPPSTGNLKGDPHQLAGKWKDKQKHRIEEQSRECPKRRTAGTVLEAVAALEPILSQIPGDNRPRINLMKHRRAPHLRPAQLNITFLVCREKKRQNKALRLGGWVLLASGREWRRTKDKAPLHPLTHSLRTCPKAHSKGIKPQPTAPMARCFMNL